MSDSHISDHLPEVDELDDQDKPAEWRTLSKKLTRQYLSLPYTAKESARAAVDAINTLSGRVDFVLHIGDVLFNPVSEQEYSVAGDIYGRLNHPVHFVPGNHDNSKWLQRVLLKRSDDEIQPTLDYEIEHDGVQIVCIDTSREHRLLDEQLAWLDSRCSVADDRPLLVFLHHNLISFNNYFTEMVKLRNGNDVHLILRKARNRLRGVFLGHLHQCLDLYWDGILYSHVGSTCFQIDIWPGDIETESDLPAFPGNDTTQLPSFNVVTITAEQTFIRHHRYRIPSAHPPPKSKKA